VVGPRQDTDPARDALGVDLARRAVIARRSLICSQSFDKLTFILGRGGCHGTAPNLPLAAANRAAIERRSR
jgi:hypothetical protein